MSIIQHTATTKVGEAFEHTTNCDIIKIEKMHQRSTPARPILIFNYDSLKSWGFFRVVTNT